MQHMTRDLCHAQIVLVFVPRPSNGSMPRRTVGCCSAARKETRLPRKTAPSTGCILILQPAYAHLNQSQYRPQSEARPYSFEFSAAGVIQARILSVRDTSANIDILGRIR